mmetsp:Transcript_93856/g.274778  ORF Transcript_93856/g.274778 Transcript_93856/m.274778 type:complete len:94 (-) Transcript_93856:150-431(-)
MPQGKALKAQSRRPSAQIEKPTDQTRLVQMEQVQNPRVEVYPVEQRAPAMDALAVMPLAQVKLVYLQLRAAREAWVSTVGKAADCQLQREWTP